ncbi:hypothetical protein EZV62_018651 [Acer yangbiense]|uniref:Serine-threonine/tyrosine-protein kinase catalytic domain-containing protein n=1 Tax=Acer yangbiense TaxID=1000413 RepID=A0A5C7HKH4_9ROSI|nr:hypothetical protein EZV62_018651 [Acer yangbiense]
MSAIDISRHKDEINLANLAINRIQKCAVDELIDPCLGFHSDEEVKMMATSVAKLAFQCLQQNKEMRPTMEEVLEELQRINSGECKPENLKEEDDDDKDELKSRQHQLPPSPPHCEESALLKNNKLPPSPISVTKNWVVLCHDEPRRSVNNHDPGIINGVVQPFSNIDKDRGELAKKPLGSFWFRGVTDVIAGKRIRSLRLTEAKCSPGRVEALASERAALLVE